MMQCKLETQKGSLVIELSPLIPRLGSLFADLVGQGAYSGCIFDRVNPDYICLQPAKTNAEYHPESHTLVRFGKRGTVMLLPDLALLITRNTDTPAAQGSIIGNLTPESVFIMEEIASGEAVGESLKFPVATNEPQNHSGPTCQSGLAQQKPPALPAAAKLKKRIRMFDQAPKVRKFKPNPSVQEHDKLFERVKAFEASLGQAKSGA